MERKQKVSVHLFIQKKGTKMMKNRLTMGLRSSFDAVALLKLIPGRCCDLSLNMDNGIKFRIEFHKKNLCSELALIVRLTLRTWRTFLNQSRMSNIDCYIICQVNFSICKPCFNNEPLASVERRKCIDRGRCEPGTKFLSIISILFSIIVHFFMSIGLNPNFLNTWFPLLYHRKVDG